MKSLAPRIPAIAVLAVGCADKQQRFRYSDQGISFLEEPGRSGMAFEYDDAGNLTGLKQGAASADGTGAVRLAPTQSTSFAYDNLGRLSSVAGEAGSFEFERGSGGQITAIRGPKGMAARVKLDESSRISQISGSGGAHVEVSYTTDDQLSELTGPNGTARLEHTDDGRLERFVGPEGGEERFEYEEGRLKAVHYGDGSTVQHLYDEDGQLNGLIDPLGQPTMFQRDRAGRVAGVER
ncbi:MAG TPA: hypothetical protein QF604_06555 [Candidatus Latescibacteria bacterium]|nr:hypothetical protein [Candidatus Latescibacterota bacterium]